MTASVAYSVTRKSHYSSSALLLVQVSKFYSCFCQVAQCAAITKAINAWATKMELFEIYLIFNDAGSNGFIKV